MTSTLENPNLLQSPDISADQALDTARDAYFDLTCGEDFEAACIDSGINLDAAPTPQYWALAAEFSAANTVKARQEGALSEGEIVLSEILASTPDFLHKTGDLARYRLGQKMEEAERQAALDIVSYYNGLIRYAAEQLPDLKASELSKDLLNTAIADPTLRSGAAATVKEVIRGAQHEGGFGQILDKTGRPYRGATTEEDKRGIDWVVGRPNGNYDLVDVKASLSDIESRGGEKTPYVRLDNGKIVMYSMIRDTEFNDSFRISDEVAAERAGMVLAILDGDDSTIAAAR
jgi:hypothetical protein